MHSLILLAPAALVEQTSDALMFELDALSVTVEDAEADTAAEQALFGEPGMAAEAAGWDRSRLIALFSTPLQARAAADALLTQAWASDVTFQALQEVPDADWVRLTQSQFDPIAITPAFWVVPSWHDAPAAAEKVLQLDPGLAFGSGTHPTTRMCLRWIAQRGGNAVLGPRVLDYGCGSGILAIASAMHGAAEVEAVDIDPVALEATQANALNNKVSIRTALPDGVQGRYGVVLANILATPLTLLAPVLAGLVANGGDLVLAGVLSRQFEALRTAYRPWLELTLADEQEGWILLTGRR